MNEEIIAQYERDLRVFLCCAADDQIFKNHASGDFERGLESGALIADRAGARLMLSRLIECSPGHYLFMCRDNRNLYINARINQIIKEKTDHEQKTQPLS